MKGTVLNIVGTVVGVGLFYSLSFPFSHDFFNILQGTYLADTRVEGFLGLLLIFLFSIVSFGVTERIIRKGNLASYPIVIVMMAACIITFIGAWTYASGLELLLHCILAFYGCWLIYWVGGYLFGRNLK